MAKNLEKLQEAGIEKFQEQLANVEEEIEDSIHSLEEVLFPKKGLNQLQIARSKLDEQKKNPIRVLPHKRVDSRSVVSLNPRHLKLKSYLEEVVEVMIQRTNGTDHPLEFILALMPGSPACFWKIPVNVIIAVERGVVLHIKNNMQWVKVKHQEKPKDQLAHLPDLSLSTDLVVDSIHTDFNVLDARAI